MSRKGSRKRLKMYVGGAEYPMPEGELQERHQEQQAQSVTTIGSLTSIKDETEYKRQEEKLQEIAKIVGAVDWIIYVCDYEPKMNGDGHFRFSKIGWHFALIFKNARDPVASAAVSSRVTHECAEQGIDVSKFLSFGKVVFEEAKA